MGERALKDPATAAALPAPVHPRRDFKVRARAGFLLLVKLIILTGTLAATAGLSAFITFSLAIRGNDVTVPDVLKLDVATASQNVVASALNLRVDGRRHDASVPADRIVAQEPEAGATLKKGRSVKVWVSLGPPHRSIPRVEGELLRSAQLLLEQNGFRVGRISEVHSGQYSPDVVIAQNPPPYAEVGETADVSLLVSRGFSGDAYVMPDFIGRDVSDVLDRVRSAPVKVGSIRYQEYPGVAKGLVVRQTPAPGSKVFARDAVVVYVSKGSEQ